jgi:hypothetical protein
MDLKICPGSKVQGQIQIATWGGFIKGNIIADWPGRLPKNRMSLIGLKLSFRKQKLIILIYAIAYKTSWSRGFAIRARKIKNFFQSSAAVDNFNSAILSSDPLAETLELRILTPYLCKKIVWKNFHFMLVFFTSILYSQTG